MTGARRRVVITGMGAVTAAGPGVEAFWRACVDGRTALRPETRFSAGGQGVLPIGLVEDPLPGGEERAAALVLAAGDEAVRGAGFAAGGSPPRGAGLVLGTCLGGAIAALEWLRGSEPGRGGPRAAPPRF